MPAAGSSAPSDSAESGSAAPASFNPYASPETISTAAPPAIAKGEVHHQRINFDTVLRETWEFFRENLGQLALFGLIVFAVNAGLQVIGQIGGVLAQVTQRPELIVVFSVVNTVASMLVQTYINIGTVAYMLKMTRTRQARIGDLFGANAYFLRGLGLTIVLGILFVGATVLCALPALISLPLGQGELQDRPLTLILLFAALPVWVVFGTILWLRYGLLSFYFLVDRNTSISESLSYSAQFMRDNKLTAFLILLVVGFLGLLFICFTCFLGQILYIPYFGVLMSVIYLSATGQPWARSGA
jgi:hypothetical protein